MAEFTIISSYKDSAGFAPVIHRASWLPGSIEMDKERRMAGEFVGETTRKIRRHGGILVAAGLVALVVACGGGDGDKPDETTPPASATAGTASGRGYEQSRDNAHLCHYANGHRDRNGRCRDDRDRDNRGFSHLGTGDHDDSAGQLDPDDKGGRHCRCHGDLCTSHGYTRPGDRNGDTAHAHRRATYSNGTPTADADDKASALPGIHLGR